MLSKTGNIVIWINQVLWNRVPENVRRTRLGLLWGRLIFRIVSMRKRRQLTTTYFFRNRPELKLMADIICRISCTDKLSMMVIGCSEGAEVYSILYTLNKACLAQQLDVQAFDISSDALAVAKSGRYLADSKLFSMTQADEIDGLFTPDGEWLEVRPELKNVVQWHLADPLREPVLSSLPKQDVVVANRFLFHMKRKEQLQALRNIASHVKPGGYLFVSGLDLDVRTQLAKELGWQPVQEFIEDIHAADETMTLDWPFRYWGLEPFDENHPEREIRYCSVFQIHRSNLQ